MSKYVVEGWNEVTTEVVEDGEVYSDIQIKDEVSVFFTSKIRAEKFRASLSLGETFITEYKFQCGCLEEGSTEVEGYGETAYCSWCI